jgi:hypothetical protein
VASDQPNACDSLRRAAECAESISNIDKVNST